MTAEARLHRIWYGRSPLRWLFVPLAAVFATVVRARRAAYQRGWAVAGRAAAPVIVIGNLTVGGTGKTPLVIWLAQQLRELGLRPGIVLRGYGGRAATWPQEVDVASDPREVGDEAVLLAQESQAIVVAGPDRLAAADRAVALGADVVLSDDGLQHYALARDFEIAVVDGERLLGNGLPLPAGPLRESQARLQEVDVVLLNERGTHRDPGDTAQQLGLDRDDVIAFRVVPGPARSLTSGEVRALETFRGRRVHALAGVGHPQAFFAALEGEGLVLERHAPGDHAALRKVDLDFGDGAPVLMTG
ncbi:MAG TPA: tetraacyldisaccharide 4'-kinase, partial [Steroidobacteraceae bacterium]|nr:tetraacyldisaccharide 4'-kinase [Steroidobacteraceae bacterium]